MVELFIWVVVMFIYITRMGSIRLSNHDGSIRVLTDEKESHLFGGPKI